MNSQQLRRDLARTTEEQMRKVSARMTESIVRRFGDDLGMWVGCGFPKSGTVWLCQLLSSYLCLPYPRMYKLPIAMSSVIHAHLLPGDNTPRTVYVVRDGRDVMVSFYFHQLRVAQGETANPAAARDRRAHFQRLFGSDADLSDAHTNMAKFVEYELEHPSWVKANWPAHADAWLDAADAAPSRVAIVRYEDLLLDVGAALGPAVERLTQAPADARALAIADERFAFARQSGRTAGTEERTSFLRKGVAGDWKNHFSAEAVEIFGQSAKRTLRRLGYDVAD